MNGLAGALSELDALQDAASGAAEVLICPPATLIASASSRAGKLAIGAQDCHSASSGAHTGDLSADMLKGAADKGIYRHLKQVEAGEGP